MRRESWVNLGREKDRTNDVADWSAMNKSSSVSQGAAGSLLDSGNSLCVVSLTSLMAISPFHTSTCDCRKFYGFFVFFLLLRNWYHIPAECPFLRKPRYQDSISPIFQIVSTIGLPVFIPLKVVSTSIVSSGANSSLFVLADFCCFSLSLFLPCFEWDCLWWKRRKRATFFSLTTFVVFIPKFMH